MSQQIQEQKLRKYENGRSMMGGVYVANKNKIMVRMNIIM